MSPEQIADIGWDRKLPTSLEDAISELEKVIGAHVLDELGVEFLKMYVDFKKEEVAQNKEKSEEDRLATFLEVF